MKPEEVRKNIAKICKTDEERYIFMETCLGLAAQQALFIHEHADFLDIPMEVSYAVALTAANLMALEGDGEVLKKYAKLDLSCTTLTTKEKLIKVIKYLVKTYKKELNA